MTKQLQDIMDKDLKVKADFLKVKNQKSEAERSSVKLIDQLEQQKIKIAQLDKEILDRNDKIQAGRELNEHEIGLKNQEIELQRRKEFLEQEKAQLASQQAQFQLQELKMKEANDKILQASQDQMGEQ